MRTEERPVGCFVTLFFRVPVARLENKEERQGRGGRFKRALFPGENFFGGVNFILPVIPVIVVIVAAKRPAVAWKCKRGMTAL